MMDHLVNVLKRQGRLKEAERARKLGETRFLEAGGSGWRGDGGGNVQVMWRVMMMMMMMMSLRQGMEKVGERWMKYLVLGELVG